MFKKQDTKDQDKIIRERTLKLLADSKMTSKAFAEKIGVTQSTISEWKSERLSPRVHIDKIATCFGTSLDYLLGRTDDPSPIQFPNPKTLPPNYMPEEAIPPDLIRYNIPILGDVRAGMDCIAEQDIEGYEPVSKDELNGDDKSEFFWLRVYGDSMEPELLAGDLALIHKQPTVDSGSLAAVLVDGEESTIKYVEYGRDWIELIATNEKYETRRFEKSDVLRIYVMGEVVSVKRDYRRKRR